MSKALKLAVVALTAAGLTLGVGVSSASAAATINGPSHCCVD